MIEKALFSATEEKVNISVPFAKFNEAKRTVSGFATLDNIDQEADCVTAESSRKAFADFRGNVREQHDKGSAIGKVVNFEPRDFFDQKTGQMYNGIYVDAYVSKGAQSAWEKVLDGTLSGFSVKGDILRQHTEYVPDLGKTVRFIDEYKIYELSLVDSPGNELCNVMAIQKSVDGTEEVKLTTEVDLTNVYWCETDRIAVPSSDGSQDCRVCGQNMKNVGWFENVQEESTVEKIKQVLAESDLLNKSVEDLHVTKGGPDMSEQTETVEEVEEAPVDEVAAVEAKEESVAEVATEEPDLQNISKALEDIREVLTKVVTEGDAKEEVLASIRKSVQTVEESVDSRLTELLEKHEELQKNFTDFKSGLGEVEKRLDTVESATAFKKSIDVDDDGSLQKDNSKSKTGKWSGSFLPPGQSYDH